MQVYVAVQRSALREDRGYGKSQTLTPARLRPTCHRAESPRAPFLHI